MKTILYTVSTLRKSGPVIVLKNLILNLDRTQYNPVVCTLSEEVGKSIKEEFEEMKVPLYCLDKRGIKTFLSGARNFRTLVDKIKPDIIHSNGFRDILLTGLFLPKKYKKCATVHCDWAVEYKLKYKRIVSFVSVLLEKTALSLFNCRIAVSSMLADLLNKKYPKMYFNFVNNGVDTVLFSPCENKADVRNKLDLPRDRKIIVWAGAFSARKDPLTFVKAILTMPEDKYFFVFVGLQDGLAEECKKMLFARKDVKFTGFITNIEEYFRSADLYVSTSLSEGFHLTVYEAMSCGLPVILTDIEVYKNLKNNPAVLFFNPKDTDGLLNCLNNILENNKADLASIARNTVKQNYSAAKMAEDYMDIYKQII